jgi:hypothetical protein
VHKPVLLVVAYSEEPTDPHLPSDSQRLAPAKSASEDVFMSFDSFVAAVHPFRRLNGLGTHGFLPQR